MIFNAWFLHNYLCLIAFTDVKYALLFCITLGLIPTFHDRVIAVIFPFGPLEKKGINKVNLLYFYLADDKLFRYST